MYLCVVKYKFTIFEGWSTSWLY